MEAVEWTKKSSFGLEQRGWLSRNFSTMARLVEVFLLTSPFIEPLIDLLNKASDYFLIEEIVEALGKIGDERAVPFLIKMLNNRSFLVRGKAATVLSNFDGQEEVIEALKRAIRDHSYYVRESASTSLGKLTTTLKRHRV